MFTATGLFETHLTVQDLNRSVAFYRDVVGLTVATIIPARRVAFMWIGGPGEAMLGLWEAPGPMRLHLHFALRMAEQDVLAAPATLRAAGVVPRDFDGNPTEVPGVYGWMPALALFFRDPDGHSVEFISMLPGPPRPDLGAVPWSVWQALGRATFASEPTAVEGR
jgi:lactoylglutathione lyase